MTLVQLRSFLAVVRHGGFTAAAKAMGVAQATVTFQIQSLEQEHRIELFHRRGRRIELTELGREFLQLARQMTGLEDDARLLLEDSGALRHGALRIGAVGPFQVTEMIEAYHARHPQVHLSVRLGNSEAVLRDLEGYACDVGIIAKMAQDERFHTQPYATTPVIAFVHRHHRFAGMKSIDLAALASEKLLMREPGSTTRKALEAAFCERGLSLRTAMEIGSREALREAVARGLGVGTVSLSEFIPDERLKPLRIEGDPAVMHHHVCCLRDRRSSKVVASFFDAIKLEPETIR
jgi:aminoethylphosphonate catabolism LysR family transcriptional regulator